MSTYQLNIFDGDVIGFTWHVFCVII